MNFSNVPILVKSSANVNKTSIGADGRGCLNVYIPDPLDLDQSLDIFQELLDQTLMTEKDSQYWLVDISSTFVEEKLKATLEK